MNVTFSMVGTTLTVVLEGELDHHNIKDVREVIDLRIERARPSHLIMDLRGVPFSDSSGIALVLGRYKLMAAAKGSMEIRNVSPQIKKIFLLSGVDKLMAVR